MSTEELPIWTVVRDVSGDGSPLIIVVRAAGSYDAIEASTSDEVAAALIEIGCYPEDDEEYDDDDELPALEDASYHVVTFAGDLSAVVDSVSAVVLNMVTREALV